jgi:hypothetical protein
LMGTLTRLSPCLFREIRDFEKAMVNSGDKLA